MKSKSKIEFIKAFGEKNLLFFVLLHHIRNNYSEFNGKRTNNLSRKDIISYIIHNGAIINNKEIKDPNCILNENDSVFILKSEISFICKLGETNEQSSNNSSIQKSLENKITFNTELINKQIREFIMNKYGFSKITEIQIEDPKHEFYICYSIIKEFGIDKIIQSDHADYLIEKLKTTVKQNTKFLKELDANHNDLAFISALIELLTKNENNKLQELNQLITDLEHGVYDNMAYKFLNNYSLLINSQIFQFLFIPTLNQNLCGRAVIESLIKPVVEAKPLKDINEKFEHYENNRSTYERYLELVDNTRQYDILYTKIATYLFNYLKSECETLEIKEAKLLIEPTNRKYNFKNAKRETYDILLKVTNIGDGLARDITINSKSISFCFENYLIGALRPKESREVSISVVLKFVEDFEPILTIDCVWRDISDLYKNEEAYIALSVQKKDVPWNELENKKPYTILAVEDRDKLYGRDEIIEELIKNVISEKIDNYKIWGQKRVGKSSIVKTLKSVFINEEKILVIYRSIGGLKNTNPLKTLNTLGSSLSSEIFNEIDRKIHNSALRERLKSVPVPEFDGSLYPLENYITNLKRIENSLKFIFILDEFDRINDEFFLPGTLGDTLSLNIGKGINEYSYVGFILVGSENMHLLDRQGINYNSYREREVDTFDKVTQYDSYKKIITEPLSPFFEFSDESIERIYHNTNGNPYFTNLICLEIFKIASHNQDYEVDNLITQRAIDIITNSSQKSHYEHFWSDGIAEESNIKKERKSDIRRRILVSYSFYYFQKHEYPTRSDININFNKPAEFEIASFEIDNTIKEFFNRKIFIEDLDLKIRIVPTLFEQWLCGPGRVLMIEGISDLESLEREQQREEEYAIKEHEILRLHNNLILKAEKPSVPNLRKYLNQFGSHVNQRRIFKLLDSIYYISKQEIVDFIKKEQKTLFHKTDVELKMGAKTVYREGIELYSFPDSYKENLEIASTFKVFSHIRSTKTLKDLANNKDAWRQSNSKDIIIIESVIDESEKILPQLRIFLDEKIINEEIPVKLVVILITNKAKAEIIKATSLIRNFKLIHYQEVEDSRIKPFIETNEIFETYEESGYAFAEVRKQFPHFRRESLNVIFETHCPSVSLPIYWLKTKDFEPLFHNSYGQLIENRDDTGERRRDRIYYANKELSPKINKFIIDFLLGKAKSDGESEWFTLKYIPRKTLDSVSKKYLDDGEKDPKETYFDFIDYKEIILRHNDLQKIFMINTKELGNEQLKWMDKLNELRRDPAHVEKPVPTENEVRYFEEVKDIILKKMSYK